MIFSAFWSWNLSFCIDFATLWNLNFSFNILFTAFWSLNLPVWSVCFSFQKYPLPSFHSCCMLVAAFWNWNHLKPFIWQSCCIFGARTCLARTVRLGIVFPPFDPPFLRSFLRFFVFLFPPSLHAFLLFPRTSGWWFQPLWKIWKSVGIIIPNICKNIKCSKPPTRHLLILTCFVDSYALFWWPPILWGTHGTQQWGGHEFFEMCKAKMCEVMIGIMSHKIP